MVKKELEAELAGAKAAGYAVGPIDYDGKANLEKFFSNFAKMAVDPGLLMKDSLNDHSFSNRNRTSRVNQEQKTSGGGFIQNLQTV